MFSGHMEVALWATPLMVYSMQDPIPNIAHNGIRITEEALRHGMRFGIRCLDSFYRYML